MLPDFPSLKDEIHDLFMIQLRQIDPEVAPVVGLIPHRRYHEGVEGRLVREDGSVDDTEMEEISVTETFEYDEFGDLSLEEVFNRYKNIIDKIDIEKEKSVLSDISEAAESVGNTIGAEGEEITPELVLEMLREVQIQFDRNGDPILPSFVIHPDAGDQVESALGKLGEEPYKSEMEEVIRQKRKEWNDRESRRKLVD